MANTNPKHTFDFEGILNMDVNQKNWKEVKKQLEDAFGNFKIAFEEGMAEEEAKKYIALFNKVFAKIKLPDIGLDDLRNNFDKIADSVEHALATINNIDTSAFKGIETSLEHISGQVDKIVDKIGKGTQKATKTAIASVAQLDRALGKVGDSTKEIEESLNFSLGNAKKPGTALKKIADEWRDLEAIRAKSVREGTEEDIQNWVKRQQAMTKFVLAYEDYAKKTKKPDKELTELYNKLLPKSYDARTNLQNMLDRRAGTYSEHKEPWAKEETLKKVLGVLQNGIKVEDKGNNNKSPKTQNILPKREAPQTSAGITVYRTVYEPDEPDNRTRAEILESWGGAEYWTNKKGVAETYADGQENPVILKGTIVSEKPFVIDAKGHSWDDFKNMFAVKDGAEVSLKDEFPELFTRIANGELSDPADIQTELNKAIKQLGHDVIETQNVIDTNNADAFQKLSTTYSVLDDRVLRVESAFAMEEQDRLGVTTFENKAFKKNIPEYYKMPEVAEAISNVVKEQVSKDIPKPAEANGENKGVISGISAKMDNLATDANLNVIKDAIISAITTDNDGKVSVDPTSLIEVLSQIQVASDNNDIISVIKELTQNLGSLVGQDETLQGIKSVLESIKTSSLSIDISPESITTAIKEALYAKDIAAGYEPVDFKHVFKEDSWGDYINQLTGEVIEDPLEAYDEYEKLKSHYFQAIGDNDGEILAKSEVIDAIIKKQAANNPQESEKWAQVIVQELREQGNKLVEAIKIILPSGFETDNVLDDQALIEAFNALTAAINKAINDDGYISPKGVMQDLLDGGLTPEQLNIVSAMKTLGMLSEDGTPKFKIASSGSINQGVALGEGLVYHASDAYSVSDIYELMQKQNEAYSLGAAVPRIIAANNDNGRIFQLQTRSPGVNARSQGIDAGILDATDEQIDRLLYTFEVLEKLGLYAEFGGDNIMFDKDKGFSMIDLDNDEDYMNATNQADEMVSLFINKVLERLSPDQNGDIPYDKVDDLEHKLRARALMAPEDRLVNARTIEAERAAASRAQSQSGNSDVKIADALNKVAQEKTLQSIATNLGDITNSIKEALYAPEIAEGYHKLDFDNTFEQLSNGDWLNKLYGNIWDDRKDAEEEFNEYFKDRWSSLDGAWTGTKEEMLDNIAVNKAVSDAAQRDWPQVIVEAINTQGGKIVEAIKVILPQNISDSIGANDTGFDEPRIKDAFGILTKTILDFNEITGKSPRDFFRGILKGDLTVDAFKSPDVEDALHNLGLVSNDGSPTFTMPDTGIRNLGVAIADRLVVTSQDVNNVGNITELQAKLDEASKLGAAVPRILALGRGDISGTHWTDEAIFQLQTRQPGVNVASSKSGDEFLQATDEQIDKLIHTFEVMSKVGLFPDFIGDNVLFDKERGFSLIDLETENIHRGPMDTPENMVKAFLNNVLGQMWKPDGSVEAFRNRVNERMQLPYDQRLVDEFGRSKTGVQNELHNSDVQLTPVMEDGAVARVVQENVLKTPATVKLTPEMDETVGNPIEQLAENLTNKIVDWRKYDGAIDSLKDNPLLYQLSRWTVIPSEMMSFEPAKMQEIITDWINGIVSVDHSGYEGTPAAQFQSLINSELAKLQAPQVDESAAKVSIDAEELKNVLSSITYNVKVVHDDDAENKVAIDEASLEATLNKVFANILNPQTQLRDESAQQEPWAMETTLQSVKGVLDSIQANTLKIGTETPSNVDMIAGSALEGRLTEIKSVLESIEKKIADGGKIVNREGAKQMYKESQKTPAQEQAARSNMMKSLINDYKTMGKLAAQFDSDQNLETKAMLENLREEIARKRQSLKLTIDENKSLRERYSIAFNAEKRLLDAAKAQEEINKKNKQDDADWKRQVKDAQRETGINAADSTYRATNNTIIRAIGTEGISAEIEAKAKELDKQNKILNNLRNTIHTKGSEASEQDREDLSKQIVKVKELKSEVEGYLKIHEKYSDADDLGDASNFGEVGSDQYWNNITAAIKNASDGKVAIKGMNADTGELTGTTKIAANTFAEWSATVDPLTGRLSLLRTGIKKTETIIEAITRKTKEVFTYFSGSSIIFKAFNELKKGIQYVRDIDLALTELKKVTDETEETYDKFLQTAAKTAEKVGSTIKDVVSSTADWARLGYSMEEAAKFAETTQILMNVSEFTDVSQATDTLISAVQAFGYTAETSMDVVDLLNTIGK